MKCRDDGDQGGSCMVDWIQVEGSIGMSTVGPTFVDPRPYLKRRKRARPGARVHERVAHSGLLWTPLYLNPAKHTFAKKTVAWMTSRL